jgi:hypothetical protein
VLKVSVNRPRSPKRDSRHETNYSDRRKTGYESAKDGSASARRNSNILCVHFGLDSLVRVADTRGSAVHNLDSGNTNEDQHRRDTNNTNSSVGRLRGYGAIKLGRLRGAQLAIQQCSEEVILHHRRGDRRHSFKRSFFSTDLIAASSRADRSPLLIVEFEFQILSPAQVTCDQSLSRYCGRKEPAPVGGSVPLWTNRKLGQMC